MGTDQPTDGRTKRDRESRSTRLTDGNQKKKESITNRRTSLLVYLSTYGRTDPRIKDSFSVPLTGVAVYLALIHLTVLGKVFGCDENMDEVFRGVMVTSIPLLTISLISGIFFLLVLLRSFQGIRKLFIVMQQICIIVFLSIQLFQSLTFHSFSETDTNSDFTRVGKFLYSIAQKDHLDLAKDMSIGSIVKIIMEVVKNFAYYEYYFATMLHSVDLYVMICNPLNYDTFRETGNVMKIVAIGSAICFIANCERLAELFVHIIFPDIIADEIEQNYFFKQSLRQGIDIFNIVKYVLLKLIFSVAVAKMAVLTRTGLRQSAKMSNNKTKQSTHHRLFIFSLVPLFMSIFYTVSEVFLIIHPILKTENNECTKHWFYREGIQFSISATLFMIGSFLFNGCFFLLFPKVRKTITGFCGRSNS